MIGMITAATSALSALKGGGGGGGTPVGMMGGMSGMMPGASSSATSSAAGKFDGAVTINNQKTNNAPLYVVGGLGIIATILLLKKRGK